MMTKKRRRVRKRRNMEMRSRKKLKQINSKLRLSQSRPIRL
jgi:hypothetical protein